MESTEKGISLVQDEQTKELFLLDGIDTPTLQTERLMVRNGVLNENTLAMDPDKAQQLVNVLLQLQRDIYERISESVDKNLHKYLDISQSFSESKNLLGENAEHLRNLIAQVEDRTQKAVTKYEKIANEENKLTDIVVGLKRTLILRRIDAFLSKSPKNEDNLLTYCQDYTTIMIYLATEKSLEAFSLQQLFESINIRARLAEAKTTCLNILTPRLLSLFTSRTSIVQKIADIEDLMACFEALNSIKVFEQLVVEDLLRVTAHSLLGKQSFETVLAAMTELLSGELAWLVSIPIYSDDSALNNLINSILANTLLKAVFNKTEYFPIASLDSFANNYQAYYTFVEKTFRPTIPAKIANHMKKKENLLYKSFIITVIKRLEGSLIPLQQFIESARQPAQIEDYTNRRYKKSLADTVGELIIKNISKETVTTTLLHRVFGIGLRTIVRIKEFFASCWAKNTDPEVQIFLAKSCIAAAVAVEPSVYLNIDEIGRRLEIADDQIQKAKLFYGLRLKELRHSGIYKSFEVFTGENLKLDDEIAGITLKLSMNLEEPQQASHLVNTIQMTISKFFKSGKISTTDEFDVKDAILSNLKLKMEEYYEKQIEDTSRAIEINRKFSTNKNAIEFKVDQFVQRQRDLDLAALSQLTA